MTASIDAPLTPDAELAQLREQVAELTAQLATAEMRLAEMGIADPVTGLHSYRYVHGRIAEEVARADRFNLEVGCLMIGLDQPSFEGLLEISRMLKDTCRVYDIPARWSQDVLTMLLPATDLDGAQTYAERFRLRVAETFASHPTLGGLTISVGVASYPTRGVEEAENLLEAADGAMRAAREAGGNRTMVRG